MVLCYSLSLKKYVLCCVSLSLLFLVSWLIPCVSRLKWGEIKGVRLNNEQRKVVTLLSMTNGSLYPLEKVSSFFKRAVIAAEDAHFYKHHGIDVGAMLKSYQANMAAGRIRYGASTITQQVVRLVFLSQEKTILRKIREILGALLLELVLTKDEILTWYINLVYFGSGIYGIKDAATYYFQTTPDRLTLAESINLAIVLPNPYVFSKALRQKNLNPSGQKRYSFILEQLFFSHDINKKQLKKMHRIGNFGLPISYYHKS